LSWFVAYCESRRELFARDRVVEGGGEAFAPFERIRRRRKTRGNLYKVDWRDEPLFPRYIFVRGAVAVLRETRGVMLLLTNGSQLLEAPDRVVDRVRLLAGSDGCVDARDLGTNTADMRLRLGVRPVVGMEFTLGPASPFGGFAARVASLASLDNTGSLTAWINMFGRETLVSFRGEDVERVISVPGTPVSVAA
jgi:transcription antitermination factor NusG